MGNNPVSLYDYIRRMKIVRGEVQDMLAKAKDVV